MSPRGQNLPQLRTPLPELSSSPFAAEPAAAALKPAAAQACWQTLRQERGNDLKDVPPIEEGVSTFFNWFGKWVVRGFQHA